MDLYNMWYWSNSGEDSFTGINVSSSKVPYTVYLAGYFDEHGNYTIENNALLHVWG